MALNTSLEVEQQDEFFLDTPAIRDFVAGVRQVLGQHADDVAAGLEALQPRFAELLADQSWLTDDFAAANPQSGMGGGIGTWLIFRAGDRSLSLFSLVVPSCSETPVHDHLAWGFVGLYRGEQSETVYRRTDIVAQHNHTHDYDHDHSHSHDHHHSHEHDQAHGQPADYAHLEVAQINQLKPGDFYTLIPPDGDIHSVKTTSQEASISIHLLANDTGCIVRHAFEPAQDKVRAFRSGYSNVACPDEVLELVGKGN